MKLLADEPNDIPGKRKCRLCRHHGHTIRCCPLRKKALQSRLKSKTKIKYNIFFSRLDIVI